MDRNNKGHKKRRQQSNTIMIASKLAIPIKTTLIPLIRLESASATLATLANRNMLSFKKYQREKNMKKKETPEEKLTTEGTTKEPKKHKDMDDVNAVRYLKKES
jgi:hypothetical protein